MSHSIGPRLRRIEWVELADRAALEGYRLSARRRRRVPSWRCEEASLVGISGKRARVTRLRCRQWPCPACGPRLQRRERARAFAGFDMGQPVWLVTLTSPANDSIARSYQQLAARWKRLIRRLRHRFPGATIEYYKVTERQTRGHAHLHVLVRGLLIPNRVLSELAASSGFGWSVDVRRARKRHAGYVTKELSTENPDLWERRGLPSLPKWHRPASSSRGWAPSFRSRRDEWRNAHEVTSFRWHVLPALPSIVATVLGRLGFVIEPAGP